MMKSKTALATATEEASPATLVWGMTSRQAAMLAAIVLATIAIYLPSLRNGWVFDDWQEFVDNHLIHSWSFVWNSFRYDSWWFLDPLRLPQSAYYRPLENTWFAVNALIFGTHPALWHLAKIVLHVVAVILCFRVAQLIAGDVTTGLLTAAIFAVMPAHAGGVVWASAIPEPLSTAFELGAMLFLIGRKPGWSRGLFIAIILYACATLTHESAILFPLIVFAYVFIFEGGDEKGTVARIGKALLVSAPFVVVAMAYMCARLNALGLNFMFGVPRSASGALILRGFVVSKPHYSPAQVLMTMPVVLVAYLAILTLPWMAGPTHAVEGITQLEPIVFISAAALVILAAAAFVFAWRSSRRRIYLFCAVWSLLTMAPALNLNALWWLVDDRYLYAPSFGWSFAVAVAVLQIAAAGSRARKAVGTAMAALLVLYAASAMQTERYWYDDVVFFERCVEIAPHESDYRLRLAGAMNKAGDPEGAVRELQAGTTLEPNDVHLHLKLAQQYQMMGRQLEFMREFQKFNELSNAMVQRQRAAQSSGASQPAAAP
jgi:protein O-mannosyl-transferase